MSKIIENSFENEVEEVTVNTPEETPKAKKDPLAKYKELSPDNQATVDEIVADVIAKIGGDDIDLPMLLGILDKLNAEKKSAKEADKIKAKERKEVEKELATARGEKLKDVIKVGDTLDYFMSTSKVTILQAVVLKVTEKSARIDVTADTLVLYKGQEMKAGDVAGLKLGAKSVPFGKIQNLKRDGDDVVVDAE